MKYNLGILDQYPFEIIGSTIENTPMFIITFKDTIDVIKLENAFYRAIRLNPLFGTKVGYDEKYFLEDNQKPIKFFNVDINNRPLEFGKSTNDFPWQVCYKDKIMTFEWFHSITDGIGAFNFLKDVLYVYATGLNPEMPRHIELRPGLEPFVDKKERGENFNNGEKGFNNKLLPVHNWGYETRVYVLKASTEEVLSAARKNNSVPSCILAIIMSKTLKKFLPEKTRNKKVTCNIVIDLRRSLNYDTQHNCKDFKRVTYYDYYDEMGFEKVASQYRKELDEMRLPKNIIRIISNRYRLINVLHYVKNRNWRKKIMSVAGDIFKNNDCNFVLTYLGKQDYSKELKSVVEDIQFRTWTDYSNCILACVDYNGVFTLNLSSNFTNDEIVQTFIEECANLGINWNQVAIEQFKQASFKE